MNDIIRFLSLSNISPHRGPLGAFFRLCLKGGSCSGHGWIVSPRLPSSGAARRARGRVLHRVAHVVPSPWARRTRCGTRTRVALEILRVSLPRPLFSQLKGLVLCSSRIDCLIAEESFGSERLDVVFVHFSSSYPSLAPKKTVLCSNRKFISSGKNPFGSK